jgi:hypothetical protein
MNIILFCGAVVQIDAEDEYLVSGFRWWLNSGRHTKYARAFMSGWRGPMVYMHSLVAGTPKGMVTDHINGDGLDNRRRNLRVCHQAGNVMNSSKKRAHKNYKGVYPDRRNGTFWAQIIIKRKSFGSYGYATEEEAAAAYDELAIIHHGEFAKLNFPRTPPGQPATLGWLP